MQAHISRISSYRDELKQTVVENGYNSPESALSLIDDEEIFDVLTKTRNAFSYNKLTDVVVIGMGGSARGSRAIFDLLAPEAQADLHTIDTIDDRSIKKILSILQKKKSSIDQIAICVVSKSGTTVETIANSNIFIRKLSDVFTPESVLDQIVIVTKPGSPLEKKAKESGVKTVSIPEQVGGRFSVFSLVGLLPLSLTGIATEDIISGAQEMRSVCLSGRPISDPAAALASIIYDHIEKGERILSHYFFTPQAEGLGSWIRQLFAESIGKHKNRRGEPVFSGVYPVTSIAPRDLHADFQLQMGGPKNFFTVFIREQSKSGDLSEIITDEGLLVDNLNYLSSHQLHDLYEALSEATIESFKKSNRSFVEITVAQFDAKTLGKLIMLEQLIVMYLGHLLSINTFNQPQVETYKDITRDKMKNK
jgi:glucose-6-phosphate isomerase